MLHMKIKHHEIEIPEENPFANCKLAREPYAKVLSDIVNIFTDGFVLAINNQWGTGKTTFVKMWQQQLKNQGFKTIYFNAWENDFDSNPLVAIISELENLSSTQNKSTYKSIVEKGSVLVKNIGPVFIKSLIKKYAVDIDEMSLDTIENAAKASTEILEEEIKQYSSRKKTIIEFRKELEIFVKQSDKTKPLIFIVDELDRCRPSYSVEVLEQIKHLFSVPGIVFALSIDKNHLASAVKGFYGSDQIDSNEYLRRFIDLEYSMPIPEIKLFNAYLFNFYQFNDFFSSDARNIFPDLRGEGQRLLEIADMLFSVTNTTLRQQERIFALTRLIIFSFKSNQYTFPHLLFILVYLKVMRNNVFQKIERNEYSLQELSDIFYENIYSGRQIPNAINLLFVESLLLWFSNNDREHKDRIRLLEKDESGNFTTPIKSRLENEDGEKGLAQCFDIINRQAKYDSTGLNFLINKINLTEPVAI